MTPAQIQSIRKSLGWSIGDAANRMSLSRTQVYNVENGLRTLNDAYVMAFKLAIKNHITETEKLFKKLDNLT